METSYRLRENVCKAHKHLISCDQKHESHFIKGVVGGRWADRDAQSIPFLGEYHITTTVRLTHCWRNKIKRAVIVRARRRQRNSISHIIVKNVRWWHSHLGDNLTVSFFNSFIYNSKKSRKQPIVHTWVIVEQENLVQLCHRALFSKKKDL